MVGGAAAECGQCDEQAPGNGLVLHLRLHEMMLRDAGDSSQGM